jgi:hypothetical protein
MQRTATVRPLAEDYFRLDLAELRRHGLFFNATAPAKRLTLFARARCETVELRVQCNHLGKNICMEYGVGRKNVTLALRQSHPTFGGVREWFVCPLCSRRCRVLRWRPGSLGPACRACIGFAYKTQRMAPAARWRLQATKMERRLGGERDDGLIYKPKHMHWRTFHSLMDRIQELNNGATIHRMSRDRGMRVLFRQLGIPALSGGAT